MPKVYLTRRERFSSAHRLFRPDYSDEKNLEVFGLCSNPSWHGHNYELFVTVKGEINPEFGYVVNLKDISSLMKDLVISKLDHKNINVDVDFMKGKIASTENLAIAIWKELELPVKKVGGELYCVKIQETENNYFEYFGEE
ncbi:MAG TPA: 6-carboxytetrahydropterin synthase [Tenuifilaceae bacterium]|nr:6-carboxytetrahydropterin synthase [Tenuifilaceae bacterium]